MAVIKYDELFDFEGYKKSIKDLEAANISFGKAVENVANRIISQYKDVREEYGELITVLKSFNVNQKNAFDGIVKNGEAAERAAKKTAEQKRVVDELTGSIDLNKSSVSALKAELKDLKKEFELLGNSEENDIKKKQELASKARSVTTAIKEQTDVLKVTTKVLNAAEGSYQALQQEMSNIGKQLKSMPDAFDKTTGKINQQNKEAVNLSKRYLELNTTLKTADAQLGNYQRNVGNYSSATHSLSQVLRELPSLAINAQTFFLAISNNLPILFDQFGQVSKQVDEMTGKVNGSGKAFKIFAQSIFSVGNLLTIGVTLLTLYGKDLADFVGGLFKGSNALSDFQKSQKIVNDVTKEAAKSIVEETVKLDVYKSKLNDLSIPANQRVKVAKEYNKVADETNQIDVKQINNLESINLKIAKQNDLILKRALSTAALSKLTSESTKVVEAQLEVDLLRQKSGLSPEVFEKEIKLYERRNNVLGAQAFKSRANREEQQKYIDQTKQSLGLTSQELGMVINLIAKKEEAIQSLQQAKEALAPLISTDGLTTDDGSKKSNKGSNDAKKAAEKEMEAIFRLKEIALQRTIDYNKAIADDETKSYVDRLAAIRAFKEASLELIIEKAEFEKSIGNKSSTEVKVIEAQKLSDVLKLYREFKKDRDSIIAQENKKKIDDEKRLQDATAKTIEEGYNRFAKAEEKRTNKQKEEGEKRQKDDEEQKEARLKREEEFNAVLVQIGEEALRGLQDILSGASENRIAKLEEEKNREIALAGNNAAAKEAIEKKFQQRINQEKVKQAKQEKAFAAFQILINTAVAISRVLAEVPKFDFGISTGLLIAAYATLGAVQLAAVLSRPLPKFKHGTKNSPEGLAIVDEAGPELIIDAKGRLKEIGGNQGPRLTHLEKGSQVITALETKSLLKGMDINAIRNESMVMRRLAGEFSRGKELQMASAMSAALKSGVIDKNDLVDAFKKAIKDIPKSDFFMDERGFRKRITEQNQKTTYLNSLSNING